MPVKLIFVLLAVIVVFCVFAAFFYRPITVKNQKAIVSINRHVIGVDIAKTQKERAQGLSGREELKENQGMLFLFPNAGLHGFWMKNMRFPIDIVWISKSKIIGFTENIDPQIGIPLLNLKIYYPPRLIDSVLEINAGQVASLGIKEGDLVSIIEGK
ncbi:MAG: DUF192 domain-containing protein [Patescibacteria group bacterium]|nr:DUF192 domain-containing protein [Patescibacteria group bacterium]